MSVSFRASFRLFQQAGPLLRHPGYRHYRCRRAIQIVTTIASTPIGADIARDHGITLEAAREHALRRNPTLQAAWLDAHMGGQPADDPTLQASERCDRFGTADAAGAED